MSDTPSEAGDMRSLTRDESVRPCCSIPHISVHSDIPFLHLRMPHPFLRDWQPQFICFNRVRTYYSTTSLPPKRLKTHCAADHSFITIP